MRRWSDAPIRVRLTAWYAGALAVLLVVYATVTYVAVRHEFLEQLDDQLHDDFETTEGLLTQSPDGQVVWRGDQQHDPDDDEDRVSEVWSTAGERIHRSGGSASLPAPVIAARSGYRYDTVVAAGERWRTLSAPVTVSNRVVQVRVARSEARMLSELRDVLLVLLGGLPVVVLLAGAGGYVLARRALVPIEALASDARRITADRLHERVTVSNQQDEIGRLASVINETFARLEASFGQLRRFTADASHELRTPLAVLRGIGEDAVRLRRSAPEYEEAIGSMLEEIDRMSTLVETLLRLSRADAGTIQLWREPVDIGELAKEVVSSLGILAEERRQSITVAAADRVTAPIDRLIVREAMTNVLDNAIKYSPAGSNIIVRVERMHDDAVIAVADEGPGIPLEQRDRIFHRFFRIDEARSREHGGTGLGLAIAKWAAEIHGGRITVEPRPGGGSEFQIRLPLTASTHAIGNDHERTALERAGG